MQKIKIILFFILFSNSVSAEVAESNFAFAYANIEKFVELCIKDPENNLSPLETELLINISKALPVEKKNKKQLIFSSEKEYPGRFILNDQIKVAKTYDDVGSEIFINKDMIKKLQVLDAVAILVHEFGHHHQEKDELALDLLGLKVAFTIKKLYLQEAYHESSIGLKVSNYNYWVKSSVGKVFLMKDHFDLILSDEKNSENLTHNFMSFNCSKNIPTDIYCDKPPQIVSSNVQNLRWSSLDTLSGFVTYICQCFDNSLKRSFSQKKKFDLNIILKNNSYQKNSASIRILP